MVSPPTCVLLFYFVGDIMWTKEGREKWKKKKFPINTNVEFKIWDRNRRMKRYRLSKRTRCLESKYAKKYQKIHRIKLKKAKILWDKRHPNYAYEHHFKKKYGITLYDKIEMIKKQNNKCLICKTELFGRKAHLDHCHKTGKIRGVLCGNCNNGLSGFRDNIENLKNAINYLKK